MPEAPPQQPIGVSGPVFAPATLQTMHKVGMMVATIGQVLAAGSATGFMSLLAMEFHTTLAIALVSGAVGFGLMAPTHRIPLPAAIVSGLIAEAGALYFTVWWLTGRSRSSNYEMVLVGAVGAAPGIALFVLFQRVFAK